MLWICRTLHWTYGCVWSYLWLVVIYILWYIVPVTFVVIYMWYVMPVIYMLWYGVLYMWKTQKKDLFGHFAVCQGLGTRQSDHLASHEQHVRRVPRPGTRRTDHCSPCARKKAHGEPKHFAVCQSPGHTAKSSAAGPRVTKFAVCLLLGTRRSILSRRYAVLTTSLLFFAVYPWIHTANVFAVCLVHTAN